MTTQDALFVHMGLDSWNIQIKRATKTIEGLSDAQLLQEVAPGRNRGVYLLGHLAAVHDGMLPLLGLGEKLHPELEDTFIKNPDKASQNLPATSTLRQRWSEINSALSSQFSRLSAADWFQRHQAISEEDFKKEPHRNRLNVLLTRTGHLAYHMGQLALLVPRK